MPLSTEDALVYLMVVTASSDAGISDRELGLIGGLVRRTPALQGFPPERLADVANACIDAINGAGGLDGVLDLAVAALPVRLHDTAYALAVEVAVVDLQLPQEELRLLEMIRDRLATDRLVTAAIEAAARARMRKLQ
ncbi:tellurite resistance TerB family protein [Devosia sp.]|uniref:tellurite resistance TerB family protein n=1 Tax=Devosia sp. TaxID=1871048 RepID=UPI002F09F42F